MTLATIGVSLIKIPIRCHVISHLGTTQFFIAIFKLTHHITGTFTKIVISELLHLFEKCEEPT